MTIYVTMIKERHMETEVHLFSTAEKAIFFAKEYLKGQADSAADVDPEDATISEEDLAASGWLFYTCFSTEGDCVWVLPKEVDESFLFFARLLEKRLSLEI
jgi:hypothetical protein